MKMLSKTAVAALAICLCGAAPVLAQDGPVASARASDTDAQIRDYLDSTVGPLPAASDRVVSGETDGPPDRSPHGSASVGIGSNGYRHADASTIVPVGQNGSAEIAVSDTRFNGRFGPRKFQSLSLGINLGDRSNRPQASACRPGDGLGAGFGLEPMWVQRLRAEQGGGALQCDPQR